MLSKFSTPRKLSAPTGGCNSTPVSKKTPNPKPRAPLDRARSHANTLLRRNTAELRRLQTDRLAKTELALDLPRLVNLKDYLQLTRGREAAPPQTEKRKDEPNTAPDAVTKMENLLMQEILKAQESQLPEEMKKQTQSQPRNEQCACGSGLKHKRCCGHWSKAA